MDYVFVVAYGRSGSTLVQGLLNTLPQTLIRGENNFFILPLYRSFRRLSSFRRQYSKSAKGRGAQSAFYGLNTTDLDLFKHDVRRLVVQQLIRGEEDTDLARIGFKEVLWHQVSEKEEKSFIDFMTSVFPNSRFILHQRNHEDVYTSGFWQKLPTEEALRSIERVEALQDAFDAAVPQQVLRTRYEALTDRALQRASLDRLATFVTGGAPDSVLDEMTAAMEHGFGPRPFGRSKADR